MSEANIADYQIATAATDKLLSDEMALRIALAAKSLPGVDVAQLLNALATEMAMPPTTVSLSELTVKRFKRAGAGRFVHLNNEAIKEAIACLRGESGVGTTPLPVVHPYRDGDMPGSIRVACASNKGDLLDGHFGNCLRFLIYQVSVDTCKLIDIRTVDAEMCESNFDGEKNTYRASLVSDCQILFVASIGGPAAAKVIRAGVHPIKNPFAESAVIEMTKLQHVIATGTAPWLEKIIGKKNEKIWQKEFDEYE